MNVPAKIYSKISGAPQEERKKMIDLLSDLLERGNNTFEPVRYLLDIWKVQEEEFLTDQPLKQKIKIKIILQLKLSSFM